MINFPELYKKTSTGAIQFWTISVQQLPENFHGKPASVIETGYGQLDTRNPQVTKDIILKGKNVGKKNETSVFQQAQAEAQAKWEKQKKKGYVESIEVAQAEEIDALIEGGISPMLAHKYSDHSSKIVFPAFVQPKLDGIRCIAVLKDGKCTLWSRTRKPITSMPHIIAEIEKHFIADVILDGELYNHDFKSDFEKIVSSVRKENPEDGYLNVQYHIYDLVHDTTFGERKNHLWRCFNIGNPVLTYLKLVETSFVDSELEAVDKYQAFRKQGYEGAILRNANGKYVNKRSYDLQKVKEMQDAEFEITGIEEGRGKLSGHAGAFICKTSSGETFNVKMSGDTGKLKEYFENHSLWQNKILTVQFQDLTSYGIPRFPVGIAIRDYE